MAIRVTLEIDLVLDEASEASAIDLAKRCLSRHACVYDGQDAVLTSMEARCITSAEDALVALVECNPLLSQAKATVECVATESEAIGSEAQISERGTWSAEMEDSGKGTSDDDLDEYDTGLYLCRWPNGDFSLVKANDKRGAMHELDEWGGAEPAWLIPMDTCIIDFRLTNEAEIELVDLGDETEDFVWSNCYPELNALLSTDEVLRHRSGKRNSKVARTIRQAVERERTRLWETKQGEPPAKTELGRELQRRLRAVGPVADHYVENVAGEILRRKGGKKDRPN